MGLGPMTITGRIVSQSSKWSHTLYGWWGHTDKHENLTFFLEDICATEDFWMSREFRPGLNSNRVGFGHKGNPYRDGNGAGHFGYPSRP